ncbi:hypothetical protein [Psychromarinibacter sp. S121]|uniref:hypothetical protein n=1 Tax=Psychromarinibacter sp. S121 TaxID=3415127 RepID=UPI003C7E3747
MTHRLTGSFVRLFGRSEFIANPDWPDDIGLAFVVADGVPQQLHPFHENESSSAVLDRIEEQIGDLTDYGIHSVTAEDHYGRHAFSFDRELLKILEDRIVEDEQLLEEAETLAINIRFAQDMGMDYTPAPIAARAMQPAVKEPAALPDAAPLSEPEATPDQPPQDAHQAYAFLGYHYFSPSDPTLPLLETATLETTASGEVLLRFDADGPRITCNPDELLVRWDRTGFALPAYSCVVDNKLASCVELPADLVPAPVAQRRSKSRPIVSMVDDMLQVSYTATPAKRRSPRGRLFAALGVSAFVAASLAVTAVFVMERFDTVAHADTPVEALRSEMFR